MARTSLGLAVFVGALSVTLIGACSSDDDGGGSGGSGGSGASEGGSGTGGSGATGGAGGGSVDCTAVCTKIGSANCPNADPQNVCESDCTTYVGVCPTQTQAFASCLLASGNVSCNADGNESFDGCDAELTSFLGCSACTPAGSDDTCETCSKASCCNQRQALFGAADILDLIDCVETCTDTPCFQGCQQQYPDTWSKFEALSTCESGSCASQCTP